MSARDSVPLLADTLAYTTVRYTVYEYTITCVMQYITPQTVAIMEHYLEYFFPGDCYETVVSKLNPDC